MAAPASLSTVSSNWYKWCTVG